MPLFDDVPLVAGRTAPGGDDPFANVPGSSPTKITVTPRRPQNITADDIARATATGVPVIGGVLNKLNAATNATLAPVVDPFLPDSYEKLPGKTWGERYDQALGIQERKDKEFETDHPVASTVAGLAGGIGSTAGLGMTALGARALGLTGTTLPGQVGRGLASNTMIGAADASVRDNDPFVGGVVGGAVGVAAPVVGRGIGAAISPIANAVRGIRDPATEASRRVATALDRDIRLGGNGLDPAEFAAARASGTPVNLMDVGGETTRALARSAANTSPEGRAVLNEAIDTRFEGQSNRLSDWLRRTFNYPNAVDQQRAIEETGRIMNRASYTQAYREGAGGLWSPELERLAGSNIVADAMRKAVKESGDEAIISGYGAMNPRVSFTPDGRIQFARGPNGVPVYPDLQFWDLTRRKISDAAREATPGTDTARRLNHFARALNEALDNLVPSYQQARAGAATIFGAENALEAGQNFVTSRLGNQEARDALARMTQRERELFQDGFVDRFIQSVRESPDRRSVLNQIANSPAARERLNIALGGARARELEAFLHVERVMDMARPAVQGNSTTARQLAELGLAGGAYGVSSGDIMSPDRLMNAALVYGAARGQRAIDSRVAQRVAQLLVSDDINQIQAGFRLIARHPRLMGALRLADDNIAALAARGATPELTSAATGR